MNNAARAANESHVGVRIDWQPFGLNLEAEMATGVEPDTASDSKRKTRKVDVRTARNVSGTDAGHYERLRPRSPAVYKRFVAEVSMKLVKNHALPGRLGQDVLGVDVGVLSCPAYFRSGPLLPGGAHQTTLHNLGSRRARREG